MATTGDDKRRVLDPESDAAALKALTHPLRIRLLGLLRMEGPSTATELAALTGESSASTSYHLRVLAKYAFVAEAEQRDGRERRWRSVHEVTSWSNQAMEDSPGSGDFVAVMRRRQIQHLLETVERHEGDVAAGRIDPSWREPAGISDLMPRLTPESLDELWQTFEAKLAELTDRDASDPRALQTVVFTAGLPLAPRAEHGATGADAEPDAGPGAGPEAVGPR